MHALRGDDTAVSEVIGVVLMVAITVLLAATVAVFFLDLGGQSGNMAPTAAFEITGDTGASSDSVSIDIESGDTIPAAELEVVVSGASPNSINKRHSISSVSSLSPTSEVDAGQTITIESSDFAGNPTLDFSAASVKVVWVGSSGSQSKTLQHWSGPDA